MAQPLGSAPARPAPAFSGWADDDVVGSRLLRGAVCGALVGAVTCTGAGILTAVGRDIVFVLGALGVLVGSLIGVGCATAVLLVLRLGGPRRSGSWAVSVVAAAVAAAVSVAGTELTVLLGGGSGLEGGAVVTIGLVSGSLALWQVRQDGTAQRRRSDAGGAERPVQDRTGQGRV